MATVQEVLQTLLMGGQAQAAPMSGGVAAPPPPAPAMAPRPRFRPQEIMPGADVAAAQASAEGAPPRVTAPALGPAASAAPASGGLLERMGINLPPGFVDGASDFGAGMTNVQEGVGPLLAFGQGFGGALASDNARVATITERKRLDERQRIEDERYEAEQKREDRKARFDELKAATDIEKTRADTAKTKRGEGRLTPDQSINIDRIVMTEAKNLRENGSLDDEVQIQKYLKDLRKEMTDRALAGETLADVPAPSEGTDPALEEEEAPGSTAPALGAGGGNGGQGSFTNPYKPTSAEDLLKAVPVGGYYVNPADGKTYKRTK